MTRRFHTGRRGHDLDRWWSLVAAGVLDWASSWWGFSIADGVPVSAWVIAAVVPFAMVVGARRHRWCGWILFGLAVVSALAQLGSWGWRMGVATTSVISAVFALHGLRPAGYRPVVGS